MAPGAFVAPRATDLGTVPTLLRLGLADAERVCIGPADADVVHSASVQVVGTGAAFQAIITDVAGQAVVAGFAEELILPWASEERVVAIATEALVVAFPAGQY